MKCNICKNKKSKKIYSGSIRSGSSKTISYSRGYTVFACDNCKVQFLSPAPKQDYEHGVYQKNIFGTVSDKKYFTANDSIQIEYLSLFKDYNFRGKFICDIGCAAGSFLDLVKSMAKQTIAVEPCLGYQDSLKARGHEVFSAIDSLLSEYGPSSMDLIVSFHLIEHLKDPIVFMQQIKKLLKKGGRAIILTPNVNDILMDLELACYKKFFYRKAHIWYFGEDSLKHIIKSIGFADYKIFYNHRFDLSNFTTWLKDEKPSHGKELIKVFDRSINASWKSFIEERGLAYEIGAIITK